MKSQEEWEAQKSRWRKARSARLAAQREQERGTFLCASCGSHFTPKRTSARYCSPKCRVRTHRLPASERPVPVGDYPRIKALLASTRRHPSELSRDEIAALVRETVLALRAVGQGETRPPGMPISLWKTCQKAAAIPENYVDVIITYMVDENCETDSPWVGLIWKGTISWMADESTKSYPTASWRLEYEYKHPGTFPEARAYIEKSGWVPDKVRAEQWRAEYAAKDAARGIHPMAEESAP